MFIIRHVPLYLERDMDETITEILQNHDSNILVAERFKANNTPTKTIKIRYAGKQPPSLDLGYFGTFPTEQFIRNPLRCRRCQKYSHHHSTCGRPFVCGLCAGNHDTDTCLSKKDTPEEVRLHCPHCNTDGHGALMGRCPEMKRQRKIVNSTKTIPTRPVAKASPPKPSVTDYPPPPKKAHPNKGSTPYIQVVDPPAPRQKAQTKPSQPHTRPKPLSLPRELYAYDKPISSPKITYSSMASPTRDTTIPILSNAARDLLQSLAPAIIAQAREIEEFLNITLHDTLGGPQLASHIGHLCRKTVDIFHSQGINV